MNRVIHFDLYGDDPERAAKFYGEVFGWKFEKWEGEAGGMQYWLIMTGSEKEPGIDGGMAKREKEWKDSVSVGAITIGVKNVDETVEKIKAACGHITMPKSSIPGVGWFANFRDTEGNILSIMQEDTNVK